MSRFSSRRSYRLVKPPQPAAPRRRSFPPHLSQQEPFPRDSNPAGFFTSHSAMAFRPRNRALLDRLFPLSRAAKREEKYLRFQKKYRKQLKEVEEEGVNALRDPMMEGAKGVAASQMARKVWGVQQEETAVVTSSTHGRRSPTVAGKTAVTTPRFTRGVLIGQQFRIASTTTTDFTPRFYSSSTARRPTVSSSLPSTFDAANSRPYSVVANNRAAELAVKIPADKEVDLKQIMDDLRDLELLDMLRKVTPRAAVGFKDAICALYPLFHKLDQGEISKVTFSQLQDALPPIFTVPWTHIADRLLNGFNYKLKALSTSEKAQVLFMQIYSIGPTRAFKYAHAGCRTLEDLDKRKESEKLKLTKAQKIGLKHREDIGRLIPRSEMEELRTAILSTLKTIDPLFDCDILGSYRRGIPFSSDLDVAIRHPDFVEKDDEETAKPLLKSIVEHLQGKELLEEGNTLMHGAKKYAGLIRLPTHKHYRRIDIRLCPWPSYPYMLLGSTGDSLLMKLLRHVAKSKGLCLNEYGMGEKYDAEDQNPNGYRPGTLRQVQNEREIFDLLGMPYVKPEEREYKIWGPKYIAAGVRAMDNLHKL